MTSLRKISAVVTIGFAIAVSGCTNLLEQAYSNAMKSAVSYQEQHAWSCTQYLRPAAGATKMLRAQFEQCGRCENTSGRPQTVTIGDTAHTVPPGRAVVQCVSESFIEGSQP